MFRDTTAPGPSSVATVTMAFDNCARPNLADFSPAVDPEGVTT